MNTEDSSNSLSERVQEFLADLVKKMGLDLRFSCELEQGVMEIRFEGPDEQVLLRENARALYAINHLLNRIFYRRAPQECSFVVDCHGYRASRTQEIESVVRRMAEKVRQSASPVLLDPMPATERRVVHLLLKDEPGVRTESEGAGARRRVVILPA